MGNPIPPPTGSSWRHPSIKNAIINLKKPLRNRSLRTLLDAIVKTADQPIEYVIEEYAIVFIPIPRDPKAPSSTFTRVFKVDPDRFLLALTAVVPRSLHPPFRRGQSPTPGQMNQLVREYFRAAGVSDLQSTNGSASTRIFYNDQNGIMMVQATLRNLDTIQQAVDLLPPRSEDSKSAVTKQGDLAPDMDGPPPEIKAEEPLLPSASRRSRRIQHLLDDIVIPEAAYQNEKLSNVTQDLRRLVSEHGPQTKGFEFRILSPTPPAPPSTPGLPFFTPDGNVIVSGKPPSEVPAGNLDLGETTTIKFRSPLRSVSLRTLLDTIVGNADQPIGYIVNERGVVFIQNTLKTPQPTFTRVYEVDPARLAQSLTKVVPTRLHPPTEEGNTNVNHLLVAYFHAAGISNLDSDNSGASTQVFYNNRDGMIRVRATRQDLDTIQQAIDLLLPNLQYVLLDITVVETPSALVVPKHKIPRAPKDSPKGNERKHRRTQTAVLSESQLRTITLAIETSKATKVKTDRVINVEGRKIHHEVELSAGIQLGVNCFPEVMKDGETARVSVIVNMHRGTVDWPWKTFFYHANIGRDQTYLYTFPHPTTPSSITILITPKLVNRAGNPLPPKSP